MKIRFVMCVLIASLLLTLACGCSQQPVATESEVSTPSKVTTTTAMLSGTGGDENACTEHYMEYHLISSSVYQYFGDDADSVIQAFSDKYKGEDSNIINFVKEYNIDKETFMRLNGFTEDNWDKPWEGTAIADSIIIGEYVDAIYSNDPAKIDAVFKRK